MGLPSDGLAEQVVTSSDDLEECCAHLAGSDVFGLDTEFVGEESYHPHLCLIQVATRERLILIDPLATGNLDRFWNVVAAPSARVVVHAGREEARLCRHFTNRVPIGFFDLQIAAGLAGYSYPLGHGTLVRQLLGKSLDKIETLTEWRRRPLTAGQMRYALDDVRYLLPLYDRLVQRLTDLGRLEWAREEFASFLQAAAPEEAPVERWRKLRGLGSCDRRKLAVIRALYLWRESTAAETNRPPRSLCRDDLIIEIARRNPRREQDLHVIRGLPRRDLAAILRVVHEARELPLDQCPERIDREADAPQIQWLTNILGSALGAWCMREGVAFSLVASNHDLREVVRAKSKGAAAPADSPFATGWRRQFVWPELLALLDGRKTLRIVNPSSDSPLAFEDVAKTDIEP
jgi:ribonuclease D